MVSIFAIVLPRAKAGLQLGKKKGGPGSFVSESSAYDRRAARARESQEDVRAQTAVCAVGASLHAGRSSEARASLLEDVHCSLALGTALSLCGSTALDF